ncbi:hypothetical protein [Psychroserpens luteolus]|uniref:hypothetical protein n=1 Tax=Psychroserpens luteolus TaxID=2855840 RepID=UPI001E3D723D|nr:hypothetical protein [Psychroserpens luteolus]MCD2258982.1 hypothetical protein [Psychroserpens luteolus]
MRTNNSKVKNTIISVYFVLILLAVLFATVFRAFSEVTDNPTLTFFIIVFGFVMLLVLVHYISKYFEYDSDGVKVVVINRGLLLSEKYNYRERKLEFEKERLYAFKFRNYIVYKTLTFYLRDSRGRKTKQSFNVTLVPRKKRRYIRQSLSKIIKMNKNKKD